jgi:hypothetical protein
LFDSRRVPEVSLVKLPGEKTPVIIKFANILSKETFLQRYFKICKNLTLKDVGIPGNGKFFINRNLPKQQYNIFKLCKMLKNNRAIQDIKIVGYCKVAVKLLDADDYVIVDDVAELKSMIPQSTH